VARSYLEVRLVPTITSVSPAPATEQKHNQNNDQDRFHVSTSMSQRNLDRLTSSRDTIIKEIKMYICSDWHTLALYVHFPWRGSCSRRQRRRIKPLPKPKCVKRKRFVNRAGQQSLRRESLTRITRSHSMKPSFLNLFRNKLESGHFTCHKNRTSSSANNIPQVCAETAGNAIFPTSPVTRRINSHRTVPPLH
jgi:hypothetical protein